MITPLLQSALEPVVRRHRHLRTMLAAAAITTLLAIAAWLLPLYGYLPRLSFVIAGLLAYFVAWRFAVRIGENWEPDYQRIAREIEANHPNLHAVLLTAVEQRPNPATGKLNFLQQRVLAEAATLARQQNWIDTVPTGRLVSARVLFLAALVALILPSFLLPKRTAPSGTAKAKTEQSTDPVTVTPGDTEIERGTGLVILARFTRDVPSEAALVVQQENQPLERLPLAKNLDDPVFGGGLPEVNADLTYRIEYAGTATRDYKVHVFEHPRLDRSDATLHYPEFTHLPEKTIPDTRRVSAVEGSNLDVTFQLNKPVKSATLVANDGTSIPLSVEAGNPTARLENFAVNTSRTFQLKLEDADGRKNKVPAQLVVDAIPNRRPELKFVTPRGDQRVSPIEEVTFRTDAWDDFGITRYGLSYTVAGGEPKDIQLGAEIKADARVQAEHVLKLEDIGAKPDELVSWYLWAEDVGPDGKPRRTETDMYFGEVRPFEEIFRPGDGQEGQESQQSGGMAGQAMQQAESQKQIISATWNLKRAEDAATQSPTEKYLKDEPVVHEGQESILEKTAALRERVDDPQTQALIDQATGEMQKALDHLEKAKTTAQPLPDALTAEKAAYNALLKLAAHEFRVTRNQRNSRGQQQGQQRQQAQLDQLEMKEEQKRYEQKSEAETPQQQQQREQLATLNRLKELAQRQQDINERLKELQNALQEAKTEKEKEEIQRQLKRLREDEQQMLADADELKQQMEQSQNASQNGEERRQLEQARSDAQKASESMEKSAATQALANGTRAAKQFEQMRDDFRKRTSGQFNDDMREMRSSAREIAENQQQIARDLGDESQKPQRRTLDGSGKSEQLSKQLEDQQGKLSKLKDDMKRVSEQAEAAEPLLSRELYDTLRKESQTDTEKTLKMTQQLAERGYRPQAQQFEEKARQGVEELKSGVERAAEAVLGDEAEALRQAREELDTLKDQLNREIARNAPQLASNQPSPDKQQGQQGQPGPGAEKGDQPGTPGSPSEQSDSEKSAASEQNGQRRSGEQSQGRNANNRQANEQRSQDSSNQRSAQNPPRNGEPREGQQQGENAQQSGTAQGNQPDRRRIRVINSDRDPNQARQANANKGERQQGEQPQGQSPSDQSGNQGQPSQSPSGNQRGGQTAQNDAANPEGQGQGQNGGNTRDSQQRSQPSSPRQQSRLRDLANQNPQRGGIRTGAEGGDGRNGGGSEQEVAGPLTGDRFIDWSDRLRKVEEMLDDPALRTEAARVREIAKGMRAEFKRHSLPPQWDMVQSKISAPLAELRNRVAEELARRESKDNLVPIDRDPVPGKYADRVRRYYEELGRGQ